MSVPSCAWVMLFTIARPRPTPPWSPRMRSLPRWNGSVSVATRLRTELLAGVLDRERDGLRAGGGPHVHGAVFGEVVDDGVVQQVRGHLQQERVRTEGAGDVAGCLDRDAALLGERKEGLGGLFREEGQVDVLSGEGPLVGAAEQEQRLGEVDRAGVDHAEAFDEFAVVSVRVLACDLEQGLRDRERGAQLVRRVGGEPPLFGDVGFEPREHRVEAVGELAELVVPALQLDAVRERPVRSPARGIRDPARGTSMRPARNHPPSRPNTSRNSRTQVTTGPNARMRSSRPGTNPPMVSIA